VQHAHQKGVIHRDLKPSNVLVAEVDGKPQAKVIDFGIAKAAGADSLAAYTQFTAIESMMGTPTYMSPEQAASSADVDTRTDIYSLGVILYELLTGRTPFEQKTLLAAGYEGMRKLLLESDPPRPSLRVAALTVTDRTTLCTARSTETQRLTRLLRGELDWVVMKCLEKSPARRYETANGLASDVRRYLEGEAVVARPASRWYVLSKTLRRHKLATGAAAAVLAATATAAAVSRHQANLARAAEQESEVRRHEADSARLSQARRAYAADMQLAQKAVEDGNFGRATDLLDQHRPEPGRPDLRGWEWRYLWRLCRPGHCMEVADLNEGIAAMSFSGDGRYLAFQGGSYLRVIDTSTGTNTLTRWVHRGIAMSHDGAVLAYCDQVQGSERDLVLWDCAAQEERLRCEAPDGLREIAFGGKDRLFIAATRGVRGKDGSLTCHDVRDGRVIFEKKLAIRYHSHGNVLSVSADGQRAAVAQDHSVCIVDVVTGEERRVPVEGERGMATTLSPDGRLLVTSSGYMPADPVVWNAETGERLGTLGGETRLDASRPEFVAEMLQGMTGGHQAWVSAAAFSADGRFIYTAGADRTIRQWDAATRRQLRLWHGHADEIWRLAAGPAGVMASGGEEGTVRLWQEQESGRLPRPVVVVMP
jgi:eukaryotic-like serine/threonine-protein kinase